MSPTPVIVGLMPASVPQGAPAVVTVGGTGFETNSTVLWNGQARPTTFVSATSLQVALTATDVQTFGLGQITVNNPGPGGSATTPTELLVLSAQPVVNSVNPSSIAVMANPAGPATLSLNGSNFAAGATVQANGQPLTITSESATQITASLPANFLTEAGTISLVVTNPAGAESSPVSSAAVSLSITNPLATFSVQPNYAPAGSPDTTITVYGQGFFSDSIVQWNGTPLKTTYSSSSGLSAVVPSSLLASLGVSSIGIVTPENLGQNPPSQSFSTYLSLPVNDIAWNAKDGLIYATLAGTAGPGLGNSLVAVDPNTGVIQKSIFVGSEPNRIAISDDGTQAFVGLDKAGSLRQVNLQTAQAGIQFLLGGGPGVYNPPFTAEALAVIPGQPNSVAVYASSGVVTIYDSGVARSKTSSGLQTYFTSNNGGLAFGNSATTLYVSSEAIGSYVYQLTVDSTGITASKQLSSSGGGTTLQYDKGRLYFPIGVVADATTGATLGQFSSSSTTSTSASATGGPIFSDSTLNLAWIVSTNYSNSGQILSFDETSFNPVSSLPVTGIGANASGLSNPADLIRWGQTGLAFHTSNQLYVVQGPIVKDTSASPSDVSITASAGSTATTGSAVSYQFQVTNAGPNTAQGLTVTAALPGALIFGGAATTQGSCAGAGVIYCDLGSLANGATATITVSGTPTVAGSFTTMATLASQSYDPVTTNNQASATTTVTGALFSAIPTVSQLSPNFVATGSSTLTLTVNGSGFTSASTVLWNGTTLPTTLVNSGQVTATVDASLLKQIGSAQVSVLTAAPGGGQSGSLTLSMYGLLNVPANAIVYDPFTRQVYAALPSTAKALTGNSLVAIDPATGTVGTPVAVGSEPNLLAETSNGHYIFIGLSGAKSLGRFNLLTQALDLTVPLVSTAFYPTGPIAATGLATLPGTDSSVSASGVGILDIAGSAATVRPNSNVGYDDALFPDASHVYTYDDGSTGAEFYRSSVSASGVTAIDGTTLLGFGGFGGRFALDGGLVYASGGGIINPASTPPSQVGVLPLGNGPYQSALVGGGAFPYAAEQKSFNVAINDAGTALTFLERFDTQHFVLEDQIQFPNSQIGPAVTGTRWAQDGLAFILPAGYGDGSVPQVLLMRGAFVVPAEAVANAAPTLASVGNGSLAAGSGNQYVIVAGSGFLPGASVLWNGVERSTTFVDAQHLQVAVGAQDVRTGGTVNFTCINPGSGASNAVSVNVQ